MENTKNNKYIYYTYVYLLTMKLFCNAMIKLIDHFTEARYLFWE